MIGGVFIYSRQLKKTMRQRARYTLGAVDGWHNTAKSGRMFGFNFTVAGKRYGGASGWESGMNEANGSPCLVEYDSLNPAVNEGHFAIALPDSLQHAPANGWRVPPFAVPTWLLKHGQKP